MVLAKRMGAVAAVAVLVLGACGGGSDGSGAADGGGDATIDLAAADPLSEVVELDGADVDPDAAAADALVAELGVEGALAGVLLALDRGYAVDQIVEAADGGLGADGTIAGVEPAGAPSEVFEETAGGLAENSLVSTLRSLVAGQSGPPEPVPLSDSLDRAVARGDSGELLVFLILALARAGYDAEQITEAILLDHAVASTYATGPDVADDASNLDRICPVLVSGGERIAPTLADSSICRDRFVDTGLLGGPDPEGDDEDAAASDGDGSSGQADGEYVIDQVVFETARYTGSIALEVDEEAASVSGDLSVEYTISFFNEDEVCTSTEAYAVTGTGSVDGDQVSVPVTLTNVSADLSGSDCSDSGELQSENIAVATGASPYLELTGTVGGDQLIGSSPETAQVTLDFTRAG